MDRQGQILMPPDYCHGGIIIFFFFFLAGGGGGGGGGGGARWMDRRTGSKAQTNLPLQLFRSWGHNNALMNKLCP